MQITLGDKMETIIETMDALKTLIQSKDKSHISSLKSQMTSHM